jgi:hypothetical protein
LPKTPNNPDEPSFLPLLPSGFNEGSFSLEEDLTIYEDTLKVAAGGSYYILVNGWGFKDTSLDDSLVYLILVIILSKFSWKMGLAK